MHSYGSLGQLGPRHSPKSRLSPNPRKRPGGWPCWTVSGEGLTTLATGITATIPTNCPPRAQGLAHGRPHVEGGVPIDLVPHLPPHLPP